MNISKKSGKYDLFLAKPSAYWQMIARSDFVQKVVEMLATKIVLIPIGLITSVIVNRTLGPEGRGLYAVALAVGATGVQFANLGLHASNTYYVSRDRSLLPKLIGNSIVVSFSIGGIWACGAWAFFTFYPSLAPIEGTLLALALVYTPFGLAYMLLQNLLLGLQDVRAYNKTELISGALNVAFIGLAIMLGVVRPETIFISGLVVLIGCLTWVVLHLKKGFVISPMPSFILFKENIRYGLKAYMGALFAFLVIRIDLIMVKYILGSDQAGYYSLAVSLSDFIFLLPVLVGVILFPKLSALNNQHEKWMYTRKVIFWTGLVMLALISGVLFVGKGLIQFLYGKAFLPSVPAFQLLMPGIFFLGLEVVAVQFLNSLGFPIIIVYVWAFSAILNILVNLFAIQKYGIIGASIVSSFCYFMVFLCVMAKIQRVLMGSNGSHE